MSDRGDYRYPTSVTYEIAARDRTAYAPAAEYINKQGYDVLSVQHEYGIFGGEAGCYLLDLVREAKMPIVTTLHTVLREPSPAQKEVLDELLQLSERVVVMSERAVGFLTEVHGLCPDKIDVIPHGIPSIPPTPSLALKRQLGVDGMMILTFGLLSPDKGIQFVIEAMPEIVQVHPTAKYIVVGATHPNVRASEGEQYRESLIQLARDLGVEKSVVFVDRFVSSDELVEYLATMDVYITPYLNPKQITSGTLAYSVGAGKAVISTPYTYATEILADGRGMLVPFRDGDAIAEAVLSIERESEMRTEMGRRAAEYGQKMQWPEVGNSYLETFARAKRDSADRLRTITSSAPISKIQVDELPTMHLDHFNEMCDDTGILQHATYSLPNRSEGYCVDDCARALLLTAFLESAAPLTPELSLQQSRFLSFVLDAYNPQFGRFRNFMSYAREWLEPMGSEDSHGRSMWSLGATVHRTTNSGRKSVADALFKAAIPALDSTTSPRTWAYACLGAEEILRTNPTDTLVGQCLTNMAARLMRRHNFSASADWPWFEQSLTYANARLAHALIGAGNVLGDRAMLATGLEAMAWLMDVQTDEAGRFVPIGSEGFYARGGDRSYFDQQPIEAWSAVSACLCAYRVTSDEVWMDRAEVAFQWFFGANLLGEPVCEVATGGCHDGLHAERVNRNQGAESTLSYLCALAEMREAARSPQPVPIRTDKNELK